MVLSSLFSNFYPLLDLAFANLILPLNFHSNMAVPNSGQLPIDGVCLPPWFGLVNAGPVKFVETLRILESTVISWSCTNTAPKNWNIYSLVQYILKFRWKYHLNIITANWFKEIKIKKLIAILKMIISTNDCLNSTGFIQEETGKSRLDLGRAQCGQLVQILTLQLYTAHYSSCPNTVQMFWTRKITCC